MNNYKSAFLITAISGLSTLLGLLFIFFPKNGNKKTIYLALAFASGVMAGVSILDLIPESINFLNNELPEHQKKSAPKSLPEPHRPFPYEIRR